MLLWSSTRKVKPQSFLDALIFRVVWLCFCEVGRCEFRGLSDSFLRAQTTQNNCHRSDTKAYKGHSSGDAGLGASFILSPVKASGHPTRWLENGKRWETSRRHGRGAGLVRGQMGERSAARAPPPIWLNKDWKRCAQHFCCHVKNQWVHHRSSGVVLLHPQHKGNTRCD